MEELDLEKVLAWRNSDRIRGSMFSDRMITWDGHQAWFKRIQHDPSTRCYVFDLQQCPVGVVNITQIDWHNNRCFWGFYRGEVDCPRGTGLAMGFLALEYIFEELKMHKLCGEALAFNQASIQFHLKLGFTQEGYFKKHIFKNEKYEDIVFMALFNQEWLKRKDKLKRLCFSDGEKL